MFSLCIKILIYTARGYIANLIAMFYDMVQMLKIDYSSLQ